MSYRHVPDRGGAGGTTRVLLGQPMSMIALGRRTHRFLTDAVCPGPLVFHHVPKCGGTSVARALRMRYLPSQATILPNETQRVARLLSPGPEIETVERTLHGIRETMLLYLLERDIRCVAAHVRFSATALEAHGADRAFVTVLREPTSRLLSHFRWMRRHDAPSGPEEEALHAFLQAPRSARFGSFLVDFFAGNGADQHADIEERLALAKNNLARLHLVGFLDDLPGFERGLRELIGARIRIGHHNRTIRIPSAPVPDMAIRQEVAAFCAADAELYDFARKHFATPPT